MALCREPWVLNVSKQGARARTFLINSRQPEVDFLHSWVMFLPRFEKANRFYESKGIHTNPVAWRHIKWQKASLLVDVLRSKPPLLELHNVVVEG